MPEEKTTIAKLFAQLPKDDGVEYTLLDPDTIAVKDEVFITQAKGPKGQTIRNYVMITRKQTFILRDTKQEDVPVTSAHVYVTKKVGEVVHAQVKEYLKFLTDVVEYNKLVIQNKKELMTALGTIHKEASITFTPGKLSFTIRGNFTLAEEAYIGRAALAAYAALEKKAS